MELLVQIKHKGIAEYIFSFVKEQYNNIVFTAVGYTDAKKTAIKNEESTAINNNAKRLLDTYGNSILRLAYSYLHNLYDAEDILQETLIKCLSSSMVFENSNHEKAWLLTVAANLSKNKIKSNRLRSAENIEDCLLSEESKDLSFVWEAVKELPQNYREAIHLFYHEGYKTEEIAKILKRKESSIRSDLKRGREKLKELLREGYDFE